MNSTYQMSANISDFYKDMNDALKDCDTAAIANKKVSFRQYLY